MKKQPDTTLKRHVILKGIARGERALAAGKVSSHQDAKAKMAKWLISS